MSSDASCVVERVSGGDATFIRLSGAIDEALDVSAIGPLDHPTALDLSGVASISSGGIGRFTAFSSLRPPGTPLYLVECPPCIVDQLNLVQGFAGSAEVLSVRAEFSCTSCGAEEQQVVDLLAEGARIRSGRPPMVVCSRCQSPMRLVEDDTFQFVAQRGVRRLDSRTAAMLAQLGVFTESAPEHKPISVRKVVDGEDMALRMEGAFVESTRLERVADTEGIVVLELPRLQLRPRGVAPFVRFVSALAATSKELVVSEVPPQLARLFAGDEKLTSTIKIASLLAPVRCTACNELALGKMVVHEPPSDPHCPRCGTKAHWASPIQGLDRLRSGGLPSVSALSLLERCDGLFSQSAVEAKLVGRTPQPAEEELPAQIGGYKIVRPLSAGGMAEVLLATRSSLGGVEKPMALKRFRRELFQAAPTAIAMFLAEARLAAQLSHPNVVQIFDVGEADGDLFIAMELIDGQDLRELVETGKPTPAHLCAHIGLEISRALAYLHSARDLRGRALQIVHRDVSPQNLLVDRTGRVVLIDFGVALAGEGELQKRRRAVAGNLAYMSPEQCYGEPLDGRSDLFSLGVVLWELLAAAPLFRRSDAHATRGALLAGVIPPLPGVPGPLDDLVRHLLHPDIAARPASADEVARELDAMIPRLGGRITPAELATYMSFALKPGTQTVAHISTLEVDPSPAPRGSIDLRWLYLLLVVTLLGLVAYASLR